MKLIYDSIIYSLQYAGGVSLYWAQLEKYLKQDICLLYSHYEKNIFCPHPKGLCIKKTRNMVFERLKNVNIKENNPFIFHSSYYRYCKNRNAINITTVHDFIYEFFRHDIKSNIHKIQKRTAIENSKAIICNSENTKNDFGLFFPNYTGAVKVIYLGLSEDYYHLNRPRKNIVIFIGGRTGYKNFEYALMLLQKLPHCILQIISGGALTKKELSLLNTYIPGRYEYHKPLSNNDLNIKYNKAKFLLYPSLYEGFGVPVIEAQAAGCPVVCCNVSSLPEVAGDAAVYISGKNIADDLQTISQLEDQYYYITIQEKGYNNCKRFSWKKCAEQTYEFYQEVWNSTN